MNSNVKTIIFWVVVVCMAVLLWAVVNHGHTKPDNALNFTEFLSDVEAGDIRNATINGTQVKGDYTNGRETYHTVVPATYPELYNKLSDKSVTMTINDSSRQRLALHAGELLADHSGRRLLDLHDAPDAERRQQGA